MIFPFLGHPYLDSATPEMEKALELKADGYLKKPCSITEILGAIETQLEKPTVIEGRRLFSYAQAQKTCPDRSRRKEEGTSASLRLKKRKKEEGRRNTSSWKVELRMS